MTAKQFWTDYFSECPQSDSDKLATAMMEKYAEFKTANLVSALKDIRDWNDDMEEKWEDPGYRAIAALKENKL